MKTLLAEGELTELNEAFRVGVAPGDRAWALEESGLERIAIASAFQAEGTCVMHMASLIRPDVPICSWRPVSSSPRRWRSSSSWWTSSGYPSSTSSASTRSSRRRPSYGPRLYERDPTLCCEINKVRPTFEALRDLDAWITAFRRDSSPTRAGAPIVQQYELEPDRFIVKVNPVVNWTRRDTWGYLRAERLTAQPALRPRLLLDRLRALHAHAVRRRAGAGGRWAGLSKWECGIHEREAAQHPTA